MVQKSPTNNPGDQFEGRLVTMFWSRPTIKIYNVSLSEGKLFKQDNSEDAAVQRRTGRRAKVEQMFQTWTENAPVSAPKLLRGAVEQL